MICLSSVGWVEIKMRIFRFGTEVLVETETETLGQVLALVFRASPIASPYAVLRNDLRERNILFIEPSVSHLGGGYESSNGG